MTTRKHNILNRLGAVVMACAMMCALAISASALDAGSDYTPYLTVEASVPHTLDFFDGSATVIAGRNTDTVTMKLKNPATITVTVGGREITANGEIVSAEATAATVEAGYTVALSADGSTLTVTCPHALTIEDFAPVITFTVNTDVKPHQAVDATLHLK